MKEKIRIASGQGFWGDLIEAPVWQVKAGQIDYLVITDVELGPAPATGAARALVAATLDGVRLIDNVPVTIGARL